MMLIENRLGVTVDASAAAGRRRHPEGALQRRRQHRPSEHRGRSAAAQERRGDSGRHDVAKKRIQNYPDVPTLDEVGIKGVGNTLWHAIWAPAGTPPEVMKKLFDAIQKAMKGERMKALFEKSEMWGPNSSRSKRARPGSTRP